MTTLPWRPDGWTVDDLDLLPDDELRDELFDGALLVTHALSGAVYREAGRFEDEVVVEQPVPLRFRLRDLMP